MAGNLELTPDQSNTVYQTAFDAARPPLAVAPGFTDGAIDSLDGAARQLGVGNLWFPDPSGNQGLPGLAIANTALPAIKWGADAIGLKNPELDSWLAAQQKQAQDNSRALRPDPARTGALGQFLYSGGTQIGAFVAGTAVAGPLGGAALTGAVTALDTFNAEQPQYGADAAGIAAIKGIGAAVGSLVPGSFGGAAALDIAAQAAFNTVAGMADRAATSSYLKEKGYAEAATRYDWLDSHDIVTDAVLGSAFGLIGHALHPSQAQVDAAIEVKRAKLLQESSLPGMPHDGAAVDSHMAALDTATDDILAGRPVAVTLDAGQFDTVKPETGQQAALRAAFDSAIAHLDGERAATEAHSIEPDPALAAAWTATSNKRTEAVTMPADVGGSNWYHGSRDASLHDTEVSGGGSNADKFGPGTYLSGAPEVSGHYAGKEGVTYRAEIPFKASEAFDAIGTWTRKAADALAAKAGVVADRAAELFANRPKIGGDRLYAAIADAKGSRAAANEFLRAEGYKGIRFTHEGAAALNSFEPVKLTKHEPTPILPEAPKSAAESAKPTVPPDLEPSLAHLDTLAKLNPDMRVHMDGVEYRLGDLARDLRTEALEAGQMKELTRAAAFCAIGQ